MHACVCTRVHACAYVQGETFNGEAVWGIWNVTNECQITMLELDLSDEAMEVMIIIEINA